MRLIDTNANRLMYRGSSASHAMILADFAFGKEGKPMRWKIENSWGEENGRKGYFVSSKRYFREFVYEAVIDRRLLNDHQAALLQRAPITLDPWQVD